MAGKSSKNGSNGTAAGQNSGENLEVKDTIEMKESPAKAPPETKAKSSRRTKAVEHEAPEEPAEVAEVGVAPKSFMTPYMLLMLRNSFLHGYAIWERLMLMGIPGLNEGDRASIYRTLRQLEREGKVKSRWDTTTEGPARRVYTLTDAGESFLQIWAAGLEQYRQSLDFFFKMYTGGTLPSPFHFNFTNRDMGKPNTDPKGGKSNV